MAKFYATVPQRFKDVPDTLRRILALLPDDYHVCLEFPALRDFDVVVLHGTGVHVVEVKNERNIVKGTCTAPYWRVVDDSGNVLSSTHNNFYLQAKDCASTLKDFLRSKSREMFSVNCKCSPSFVCLAHRQFWSAFTAFPYICIPDWHPSNAIERDNTGWCWSTQGSENSKQPQYLLTAIQTRHWLPKKHSQITLTKQQIDRIVVLLGLEPISSDEVMGRPFRWLPTYDRRVQRGLRQKELEDITAELNVRSLVAITGEPKCGKSVLAQLLAADLQRRGAIVHRHDFAVDRASIMLERFLTRAGTLQVGIGDNISAAVGVLCRDVRCLILDNVEEITDPEGVIVDDVLSVFLEALVHIADAGGLPSFVVATSRYPLYTRSLVRIHEYRLSGISRALAVPYLNKEYGWKEEHACRIYGIRGGNPLSLHLCSTELRAIMALGFDFEQAYVRLSPRILQLTYGELYDRLSKKEKVIVEIISLHPDGMSALAIEEVAQRHGIHEGSVGLIAQLHEKGCISQSHAHQVSLLPQDRNFVYERISTNDATSLHAVAASYYRSQSANQGNTEYESQRDCDLSFYHSIKGNRAEVAFEVLFNSPLWQKTSGQGIQDSTVTKCQQIIALSSFEHLSNEAKGNTFLSASKAYCYLGQLDTAESLLSGAGSYFAAAGSMLGQATCFAEQGLIIRKRGLALEQETEYYDLALVCLEGAVDITSKRLKSIVLGRLARARMRQGSGRDAALTGLATALELAREINDRRLISSALSLLGAVHRELRCDDTDLVKATDLLLEGLRIAREIESREDIVNCLSGLGKTYETRQQYQEAEECNRMALEMTSSFDVYGMIDRLCSIGHLSAVRSEFDAAEVSYRRALDLAQRIGAKRAEAEVLDGFGTVYRTKAFRERDRKQALLETALAMHEEALNIELTLPNTPAGRANRHQELGRTLLALRLPGDSIFHFQEAIVAARQSGRKSLEAFQFVRLGEAFEQLKDFQNASICYDQAYTLFNSFDSDRARKWRSKRDGTIQKMDPISRKRLRSELGQLPAIVERLVRTSYSTRAVS